MIVTIHCNSYDWIISMEHVYIEETVDRLIITNKLNPDEKIIISEILWNQ